MAPILLEYEVHEQDFIDINIALAKVNGALRNVRRWTIAACLIGAIFFTLIALILNYLLSNLWGNPTAALPLIISIGSLIIILQAPKMAADAIEMNIRKQAATPAMQKMFGARAVVLGAEGITISSTTTHIRHHWAGVQELLESEGYLFLQFPLHPFLCIPGYAFKNDDEYARVSCQIREWVKAAGGKCRTESSDPGA